MRFELALIVGILFFCSWCAYIVARMNSSVNVGTSATASAGASSSLSPLASLGAQGDFSAGVGAGAGDLSRTVNGSGGGARSLIGHANAQQQQPTRLFEASEPIPSAQFAPTHGVYSAGAGRNWPPYASSGVDSAAAGNYPAHAAAGSVAQQPLNGLQQWQSYALPSHAHAGAPAPASQPLLLEYNNSEQPEVAAASEDEEGEGPEDEGGVADYPRTAAASDEEPVEGEEEEQTESPPPETELEEIANRRSFDELQSDSSERDKDGRVVVTKRRHLINGRPVPVKRSQRRRWNVDDSNRDREGQADDEHQRAAASSRVQRELAAGRSEADFEKLVEEIDEEDKLRKKSGPKLEAVPGTGTPAVAQSPELGAGPETTTTIGRRSDPDTPPREPPPRAGNAPVSVSGNSTSPAELTRPAKNKAKDSHEHSLQESLTAQQWDDDSATSGAAVTRETAPEIADNDEDQERVANIVERDREAQRLAQMSRDLLLSPERVSRELDQDDSGKDQEEEEEREERRRRRRKRDTVIRSSVPFANLSLRNPSAAPALESAATSDMTSAGPRAPAAEDLSSERIDTGAPRADERQTGSEVGASLAGGASVGANKPDGGQKQVLFFPNLTSSSSLAAAETHAQQNYLLKENDTMARHLIHAANSTRDHNHHHGPLFSLAPDKGRNHLRAQADNSSEHTHLSGLEDMHIEVLADPPPPPPQVGLALGATPTTGAPLSGHAHLGNPQLASESHKVKKESKVLKGKKKKKKKFKKASKSKMVDSKYKAARAYARKHASRNKQGQTRKRRRKSEKNLVAQRKRFKGATRGNKFARGQGAHGAKKGANLFKDKGYKKRGFKKAYHKLETGDHKTYFDEFRDKDHHKKWKNFDDRHKYAQRKHWAGSDSKHLDRHKLRLAKARAHKAGKWRESATNKHTNELDKYKKYKNSTSKSKAVKSSASKKKKKKKKKAE